VALLLDTHAVLWYALDDAQLSNAARTAIDREQERVCVSPASFCELAIKISHGRYKLASSFQEFWDKAIAEEDLHLLPIEIRHANRITTLPFFHKDPLDRMLVAQALCDNLILVSNDSILDQYGIQRIW
jgi:PIN domain nuclease of toxin-antitoxin system